MSGIHLKYRNWELLVKVAQLSQWLSWKDSVGKYVQSYELFPILMSVIVYSLLLTSSNISIAIQCVSSCVDKNCFSAGRMWRGRFYWSSADFILDHDQTRTVTWCRTFFTGNINIMYKAPGPRHRSAGISYIVAPCGTQELISTDRVAAILTRSFPSPFNSVVAQKPKRDRFQFKPLPT